MKGDVIASDLSAEVSTKAEAKQSPRSFAAAQDDLPRSDCFVVPRACSGLLAMTDNMTAGPRSQKSASAFLVLVSCNSTEEATAIGDAALAARHAACFDVLPRTRTRYFWPPNRGTVEEGTGALLLLETLEDHVNPIKAVIQARHSDELPFIGALRLEHVDQSIQDWLTNELTA